MQHAQATSQAIGYAAVGSGVQRLHQLSINTISGYMQHANMLVCAAYSRRYDRKDMDTAM
jgi:hypothetical protein